MKTNWCFKNINDAYEFLESRNQYGSKLGLYTMERLMGLLEHPEDKVYTIHIAGTNGKGSVGAYLTSIFQQAGLITYHYSSPAVFHPRDVWRRNGERVSDQNFIECASRVYEAVYQLDKEHVYATRFEVETAMAIYGATYLHNDTLILETGMGGAEDATNVIKRPQICAFTNISFDHMQFLGDTLTEIATVKAGIIKPACEVFSAEQAPEVKAVLDEKMVYGTVNYVDNSALELISIKPGELKFRYKGYEYETSLAGLYQMKNAALAIEIALHMKYPQEMVAAGSKAAKWKARFEVLSEEPYFIIDGAHNVDAIEQLAETINFSFTNQPIDFIIGVLKDKEYEKMMEIITPLANRIYTITPPNARGLDGKILAEEIRKMHQDVICCDSINEAVTMALDHGKETGNAILAFGSLSYLGEVRDCHDKYYKISRKYYED